MPVRTFWKRFEAVRFFSEAVDLLFKALILFVLAVLATGLVRLLWESWTVMLENDLKAAFGLTVTNLLSFFIILELFKSLVEYFREHRLKLTFIVDATLVFLLREIMVGLYQHQSSPWQLIALAALALVLGLLRTLAIVYSPMERRLVEQLREPRDGRTRSPEDDSETKIPEHALSVQ
ncbi:MAG TPA: phosphate-starvation-inducible PsiE family protein [candidate division Zixibacteria bacterium]|nr:phosphate-starvation-inducible PsiE family protein [candidate division Zixibacteria bacterium]